MRGSGVLFLAAAPALLALAACAPVTRVVMLPQPGHDSVVEVAPRVHDEQAARPASAALGTATVLLTKPYQTAAVETENQVNVTQSDAARVKSRYGALLAVQPPAERRYLLYFEFSGTQLTPESAARLNDVMAQALARSGNEIVVTGYTDSVGTPGANDRLSLQRAQVIRQAIIRRGFDPARVYAAGRGARDPLVPASDRAAEQKNRRVEITVR